MKRTFRAYRDGIEVGKTTTQRDDRAYVAAVLLTYPADHPRMPGRVRVASWSSDPNRVHGEAARRGYLRQQGYTVEVVTDIRLDPPKTPKGRGA